jgi:spermidine/putrescine transport system substrate-binding protein
MNPRLTRQELLRRGAAGGALLAFPSILAACGGGGGGGSEAGGGELKDVLNFENWPYYMDTASLRATAGLSGPTTLEQFDEAEGIKVNYYEGIDSNDGYFAKIQGQLSQGQGIGRDIFVATDNSQFPSLYVSEEYVLKLDKSLIPNIDNLIDAQTSPGFDPNREYSLPWLTGIDGIGWNEDITGGPVTSITQLFTDPKLKGKVTVLGEMADTLGLVLIDNGDDPANVDDAAFDRAIKSVQDALDSGQILKFTGNDYGPPLVRGDFAACIAWSGDLAQLVLENDNLKWAVPEKGGIIWTDNMFIPLGGSVPTASTYMNFVYDPKISAQIALATSYISSVKGAKEEAVKLNPDAADNELVFPSEETLANLHMNDPEMVANADFITTWQALKGQ